MMPASLQRPFLITCRHIWHRDTHLYACDTPTLSQTKAVLTSARASFPKASSILFAGSVTYTANLVKGIDHLLCPPPCALFTTSHCLNRCLHPSIPSNQKPHFSDSSLSYPSFNHSDLHSRNMYTIKYKKKEKKGIYIHSIHYMPGTELGLGLKVNEDRGPLC